MDFELPGEDDRFRLSVRSWIGRHPSPGPRLLLEAGYMVPHYPKPYGMNANPIQQIVVDQELKRAGVRRPPFKIGRDWVGPLLLNAGTPQQLERYMAPMLAGEEIWCQLFSEPDAGSDLANCQTYAERDGDHYVINGQKIWASHAHLSQVGILLCRTNRSAPKHKGLSLLICEMNTPGITLSPIMSMIRDDDRRWNHTFFDGVQIPVANRIGPEDLGWDLTRTTLNYERSSMSATEGLLWGDGPELEQLLESLRAHPLNDEGLVDRLVDLYIEDEVLRLMRYRSITLTMRGQPPGPEVSARRLLSDLHGQRVMRFVKDAEGPSGLLGDRGCPGMTDENAVAWHEGFLFTPALTLGGGTAEIQRNIIGEQVLGLPREPKPGS